MGLVGLRAVGGAECGSSAHKIFRSVLYASPSPSVFMPPYKLCIAI